MKYNIGDKVVIMRCPNTMYIGVTGTIVIARVDGTYNVMPDKKVPGGLGAVYVYGTEIAPA